MGKVTVFEVTIKTDIVRVTAEEVRKALKPTYGTMVLDVREVQEERDPRP
jgi:hypothetical protein